MIKFTLLSLEWLLVIGPPAVGFYSPKWGLVLGYVVISLLLLEDLSYRVEVGKKP